MPQPPKSVPLPVNQKWYADGLRFKCTQCGNCCSGGPGFVWLTVDDMHRIAQFLHMEFDAFTLEHVRKVADKYSLKEKRNYDCVFLKREGGKAMCGVYPVRPMQCKTNVRHPDDWAEAAEHCPGMCDADAPRYELDHIEKCRNHPESP